MLATDAKSKLALREELDRVEEALSQYRSLPQDVCIGKNGPADKVTWLVRRLQGHEKSLAHSREVARTAVASWRGHQEKGMPPGCGYNEAEIQALIEDNPWL